MRPNIFVVMSVLLTPFVQSRSAQNDGFVELPAPHCMGAGLF